MVLEDYIYKIKFMMVFLKMEVCMELELNGVQKNNSLSMEYLNRNN